MSNRTFDKEQIEALRQSPNVSGCSEKSISYHQDFKILAVEQHRQGLPPSEIFRQAGFDINMIGHEVPKECLRRWRRVFRAKGTAGLKTDGRGKNKTGGRPKKSLAGLTDKEKLKRLTAEVAYLREENRFLAKLRKKSLN